ncbi:hypothetical protein LX64_04599 [Chitinophaga skermanii]|uniref:Uncharacterized protein n=1 Tax=Chitinophaga skermanii TaxID=331697 RepID=A0A327Q4M7_9BACT|nr:hypothetical protein [Chitinophaga skermanii]RAI99465.1 hypothetical protein LX64_04599 [Chitinophaga skermanii]
MRQSFRIASFVLVSLLAFSFNSLKAQLKIGGNPYSISPASILELESDRQGLLLPRLTDFSKIDPLNPPTGMVVYITGTNPGIYVKTTTGWEKLAGSGEATANWGIAGNTTVDAANHFIGSVNAADLVFKTSNVERMRISAAGVLKLNYANVADNTTDDDVLIIKGDGTIERRTLDEAAFGQTVKTLNGLKGAVTIATEANTTNSGLTVDAAGTTVTLKAGILNSANATATYGFLSKADYDALMALGSGFDFTAVAAAVDDNGGKITYNTTTKKYDVQLYTATETHPGMVSTGAQTFGGDKTFKGAANFDGITSFSTDVNLDGKTFIGNIAPNEHPEDTATYDVLIRSQVDNSIAIKTLPASAFKSAISKINGLEGPEVAFKVDTASALGVSASGNDITLQVPSASATEKGLVTVGAQTFAGEKTFQDRTAITSSLVIGGPATAASASLTVQGSIALPIRNVTGSYTVAAGDYTVVLTIDANATITLPSAVTNKNRVIIVKKVWNTASTTNDTNVVTLSATAGNIDGNASISFASVSAWMIQSDGANWFVINK